MYPKLAIGPAAIASFLKPSEKDPTAVKIMIAEFFNGKAVSSDWRLNCHHGDKEVVDAMPDPTRDIKAVSSLDQTPIAELCHITPELPIIKRVSGPCGAKKNHMVVDARETAYIDKDRSCVMGSRVWLCCERCMAIPVRGARSADANRWTSLLKLWKARIEIAQIGPATDDAQRADMVHCDPGSTRTRLSRYMMRCRKKEGGGGGPFGKGWGFFWGGSGLAVGLACRGYEKWIFCRGTLFDA